MRRQEKSSTNVSSADTRNPTATSSWATSWLPILAFWIAESATARSLNRKPGPCRRRHEAAARAPRGRASTTRRGSTTLFLSCEEASTSCCAGGGNTCQSSTDLDDPRRRSRTTTLTIRTVTRTLAPPPSIRTSARNILDGDAEVINMSASRCRPKSFPRTSSSARDVRRR